MAKVLLIDDEVNCLSFLELSLREDGFDVRTATNGKDGLEEGIRFRPDVLVSDWKLRDKIDGIDLARNLQKELPSLKVILFSGSPCDELQAHATGFNLFLALEKPLGLDEVTAGIRRAVAK
jgi:DNA-binding response OmpR family regulator